MNLDQHALAKLIMGYLLNHPEASDSMDGIVQWWLMQEMMRVRGNEIEQALQELISKGFIRVKRSGNAQAVYLLEKKKITEIEKFLLHE